jgi:hypothetical protein
MLKLTAARCRPNQLAMRYCAAIYQSHRDYKLGVSSIRKGQVVQHKDKPMKVMARDHVATGRGGAVIKVGTMKFYVGNEHLIYIR